MRFLTQTFLTFSMFALGNAMFACGVRSVRERSFEEASSETEVGRRLLAPEPRPLLPLALSPLALSPRTPPACKPNPNLNQRPPRALFCTKLDNSCYAHATVVATTATLSSNSCKSFFTHFTSVQRKQFAGNDTFLREANSYKRALALRNSRLMYVPLLLLTYL